MPRGRLVSILVTKLQLGNGLRNLYTATVEMVRTRGYGGFAPSQGFHPCSRPNPDEYSFQISATRCAGETAQKCALRDAQGTFLRIC
jgi:hypothetical protein